LSRVFSERITHEHREIAFIEGIARFAAGLGVSVVATHIESEQQLVALRGSRSIAAQGYAIARPMTVGDAQQWRAALGRA
jgi:EAL domain-containing protein (putative c-di-GMP-specific phosphodiesterase class I)